MKRIFVPLCAGLALSTTACATMDPAPARIAQMSCDQLETALVYERDARREGRRLSLLNGIASIAADDDDFDDLSLQSDIHLLDAENSERHIDQIEDRMAHDCS